MSMTAAADPVFTRAALAERIARQPRVSLAHLPTPLDFCPRLTEALGGPDIWVKRDDLTGLCFGGNKTRQLEFLLPQILTADTDTVVAGAYTQSNWCRQITAAARRLGLEVSLMLLHGEKGPRLQGNLLLDRVMGAEVTVVDLDSMEELTPHLERKVAELEQRGRKPCLVRPFDLEQLAIATVGYVNAMVELDEQLEEPDLDPDYLYLSGANMTPAGTIVGLRALGRRTQVVAIPPIQWREDRATDIARVANAAAARLDLGFEVAPEEVTCDDGYIGPRYGVVTPGCRDAIKLVAGTEGIILDPVYSSKAMAGLTDHIARGRIGKGESVVFLHTGGLPALFAYAEDMALD